MIKGDVFYIFHKTRKISKYATGTRYFDLWLLFIIYKVEIGLDKSYTDIIEHN